MFDFQRNRRRRVFINHKHGALTVRIERHNDRTLYIFMLTAITTAFVFFMYMFVHPFFHGAGVKDLLLFSPFIAFILAWYLIGLRVAVWRAFGVEQVMVKGGFLHWTRRALFWKRNVEISATDVTEVRAITSWHALSTRVEFTAHKHRRVIATSLLHDETKELTKQLRRAISLRG
jgi:hypothetical protein